LSAHVAIIGAGPAGSAAAIHLQRAGIPFILLEKNRVGGLLWNARRVENILGNKNSICGADLARQIQAQLHRWGIAPIFINVQQVQCSNGQFLTYTQKECYYTRAVLIATGTVPRRPEPWTRFSNVYDEMTQIPVDQIHNRRFTIVGGGDAAFDYALYLHDRGGIVNIRSRSAVRCLPLLKKEAVQCGISITENCSDIATPPKDNGFTIIACGRTPNLSIIDVDILQKWHNRGVFMAGDVQQGKYRQAAIAFGDGLHTAMRLEEWLHEDHC
jgi:thioredoxin reductase (NADPH)